MNPLTPKYVASMHSIHLAIVALSYTCLMSNNVNSTQ